MTTMLGESGYTRVKNDAYFTPAWCTEALLSVEDFHKQIWDPACGDGAILKVAQAAGKSVYGSDIRNYGWPDTGRIDFLKASAVPRLCDIITNPPYDHAQVFIERALRWANPRIKYGSNRKAKVAMLLRNEYDSASRRRHLFAEHPAFKTKLVLTKRPKWFENDKASPRHNFAWFVWDWNFSGEPTIGWLPLSK